MVVPYTRPGFGSVAIVVSALVVHLAILSPQASAAVITCDGDANGDGIVNFADITSVLGDWLNDYTPGTGPGDANGDGVVNFADITSVLGNWLSECVSTLRLDEPGTWHTPPAAPSVEHDFYSVFDYCATSVYAATGEFHHEATDLVIPGRGLHYGLARKYRSRAFGALNAPGAVESVMGNNWTHSYDIRVEDAGGGNLLLHDGNSRKDFYEFDPLNLVWVRSEFFREISQELDLSYTVEFAHTGVWRLNPLDGSTTAGKINAIEDRNGNIITFQYNPQGQLEVVIDALSTAINPREILYTYFATGMLQSITDWTGRSITYAYYNDGDAGGSFGDLKSVTTPSVVTAPDFPIPPGHEYPAGKTTTYTYSTGFADERLNHNLLTITDPKGQMYLVNTYATPVDPSLVDFDRLSRQVYGNPTDTIDFFYKRIIGDVDATAILRTFVNDRNGNVEEWIYDDRNRPVRVEEFTGRADPLLPTTDTTNRPVNPIRSTDPSLYTAILEWNTESLPTRHTHPNRNIQQYTWEFDFNPASGRLSLANLRDCTFDPGPLGGDQSMILELFVYDFPTNFVTQHTDGRGNITRYVRDPNGNVTQKIHRIPTIVEDFAYNSFGQMIRHIWPDNGSGHRREDAFTYYDILSPQHGYLHERIVDATALALTTRSTYDRVGNEIRFDDAKGREELYIHNQLNQCVLFQSRAVQLGTPPSPLRYETELFYDLNDMPARVDVLNVDENGIVVPANTHITTIHEYDILNYCVSSFQEKVPVFVPRLPPALDGTGLNPFDFIKVEYEYDANRNRTLVRSGEATNGNQPNNVIRTEYDERDLIFRAAEGDGGPDQSTTQFDYDGNAQLVRREAGVENVLGFRVERWTKDGFNRTTSFIDPMGNDSRTTYDANSNVVRQQIFGAAGPDAPGNAGDVRLKERNTIFDPLDRPIQVIDDFFDPITLLPLDDGSSIRTMNWTDCSMVSLVIDDRSNADSLTYDTAIRPSIAVDSFGNRLVIAYDANSNVQSVRSEEVNGTLAPGSPFENFVHSTNTYDALDRLVSTTDGSGNTTQSEYDSRSNVVRLIDPNLIETRIFYDPLSRPVQFVRDMNGTGADPLDPADILLEQVLDDICRVVTSTDDNGNDLQRFYDDINRLIEETIADTTIQSSSYDVYHNVVTHTDANGSTATNTYDLNNRLVRTDILVGPGVSAETTFEEFDYDGLDRLLRAEDDDSVVLRAWDSLDNLIRETIDTRTFQYTYDGVGNQLSVLYPSTTFITRTYDALDRVFQVFDSGFLGATYQYAGPSRVVRRTLFNNTTTNYVYDGISGVANPPGDLGFKQLISTNHLNTASGFDIDVREYKWDGVQNKTEITEFRAGNPHLARTITYDNDYRMFASTVQDAFGMIVRETQYQLDGVGNRRLVTENTIPMPYFMDPTFPFPADLQVNQYTQTPDDLLREHDENGNLTSRTMPDISVRSLTFNYYDNLVAYADPISGTSATYRYDALGRRIAKVVTTPGGTEETQFTFALEEQCNGKDDDCDGVVEEWDGAGVLKAGFIRSHGRQLFMNRSGLIRAYHYDDLGNTTVLTDNFGNITERYEYDDYGRLSVFDSVGNPIPSTSLLNPYLYQSHFHDPETGYYLARNRYLDPESGRFLSRDPEGIWADGGALGNGYTYAGNNPWTNVDPNGRAMMHSGEVNAGNTRKHGGGGGAGKVNVQDMSVAKTFDKSSPKLNQACCNGKHIPKISLQL